MYSPRVIAQKASLIESQYPITLREYSLSEIDDWTSRLRSAIHVDSSPDKPKLVRPLQPDEQAFIANEIFMCKISYPYWATRYAYVKSDKGGVVRVRFWESQEMLLAAISALEEAQKPILIINLKARQIGASTLSETIMTHKVTNSYGITSLVASDEPSKSEFLFNMMERVLDHLPFYLRPHRKYQVKGTQLVFDKLDSNIYVDSGNKRSGGLGQGQTVHCGHLSELATWNDTVMITQDLIPAILSGASPNTFFIMESTANGKSGDWYQWWRAAVRKKFHDFTPVFIPWWKVKEKYAADPATDWGPSERIIKQALIIKQNKGYDLTRKQMYWWDKTYESYRENDRLHEFFAEFCSDSNESFQLSGKTVFSTEKLNDLARIAKEKTCAIYEVQQRLVHK